ncbi:MAG: hypothetical protein MZV64_58780 [Ignavibacteriales bacterium]|nr:hypothetical protein [Ignavibacteriales bacterium]
MDGAPVFQVAEHGHGQAVDCRAEFLHDGERIEQRLRGMFAHAVARVDDGFARRLRRDRRRPRFGMTQHDHIGITFERADGIRQALALRHRRILHLVDRDDASRRAVPSPP